MFSSISVTFICEDCVCLIGKGANDILPSKYILASNWVYPPKVRFTNLAKYEEGALGEHRILETRNRKCAVQNASDFSALKVSENKNFLKI